MELSELKLFNFKNHESGNYKLSPTINGFYGKNGTGKTNLLDAIYMLSCAKSYFNVIDSQLVRFQQDFFSIKGNYGAKNQTEILLRFTKGKKTISHNGKKYKRLIDHIGFIPAVIITPYDISLILGTSEERRRFIDLCISQVNKKYLQHLSLYKKVLLSRNAFLKANEGNSIDPILLESYDIRLIENGNHIFETRKSFIKNFNTIFNEDYTFLAGTNEEVGLEYISDLHSSNFKDLLNTNLRTDTAAQRTTKGVHKDDLNFSINGLSLKKYGSQGQIKSVIIAAKLAQFSYFYKQTKSKPILLLDDIFEKIDLERAEKLMQLIAMNRFGQIIISDTEKERMEHFLKKIDVDQKFFEIGKHA